MKRWICQRATQPIALAILAVLLSAASAQAAGPNEAAVIVDLGNGQVLKSCVQFSSSQISGYDVLQQAGLNLDVDAGNPEGVAICSINGVGCSYPAQACFCQCNGGASCVYWSYWHLVGGAWQYSAFGAANSPVHNGDVDGWVWGAGSMSSANPPPSATFDQICPAATATPTTAPSATPVTPTATNVPPTATPVPPTATNSPPTATSMPQPTETSGPQSAAGVQATATNSSPSATPARATATDVPPSATPAQVTSTPQPTATPGPGVATPTPAPVAPTATPTSVASPTSVTPAPSPGPAGQAARTITATAGSPAPAQGGSGAVAAGATAIVAPSAAPTLPPGTPAPSPVVVALVPLAPSPYATPGGPTATPLLDLALASSLQATPAPVSSAAAGASLLTRALILVGIVGAGCLACGLTLYVVRKLS